MVIRKLFKFSFSAQAQIMTFITRLRKTAFPVIFAFFSDGLRPDAEYSGFVLACLDYLHPCRTDGEHGTDVAIGATPAGAVSGAAAVDCAEPVGVMHFCYLVVILLDVNTGAVHHGKQSN